MIQTSGESCGWIVEINLEHAIRFGKVNLDLCAINNRNVQRVFTSSDTEACD